MIIYSKEVDNMCVVKKGAYHGPAPIPEEGKWIQAKEIKDISGYTHGVGWCAPQQGACKLSLNIKEGVIVECLIETIGCTGMTHSAAMASEILPGKTILEALNTDLVCDAINTAMRELFLQIVYGRSQSAFSENGLAVGAGLEDDALIEKIRQMMRDMNVPLCYKDAGLDEAAYMSRVPRWIEETLANPSLDSHGYKATREDLEKLYRDLYYGA